MAHLDRGIVFREIDRLFSEGTLAGLGDSQLLERYLTRRDEAAFEALVNLHGPMVLGLCRRILHDPRDIEDAFQATFLVLVRKASTIHDRSLLSNWLYGVALKVATRARASAVRRRGRETPMNGFEASVSPVPTDASGLSQVLDQELSRLPAKYRVPLVMCYLRGQTHDQAAAELSWPVGTVRSRMARGRELLRRRLTRRGVLSPATIIGAAPALPAQLLSEVVPQSLVAATVEAAFSLGPSLTIPAGTAASVLALTQGVLTSMKLTQLKWVGLALLSATLSTGSAIVVASAGSSNGREADAAAPNSGSAIDALQDPRGEQTTNVARGRSLAGPVAERITALEPKIDQIWEASGMGNEAGLPAFDPEASSLDRLEAKIDFFWNLHFGGVTKTEGRSSRHSRAADDAGAGNPTKATTESDQAKAKAPSDPRSSGVAESAKSAITSESLSKSSAKSRTGVAGDAPPARSAARQLDLEHRGNGEGPGREIRELEAQIKVALPDYAYAVKLHSKALVSERDVQVNRSKVFGPIATLEGMQDDLAEEIESLELEIRKKVAMLKQARAQRESPAAVVARNKRLNTKHPGVVADEEVAKSESDLSAADAQVVVKEIEVQEAEMRRLRLVRRRDRIQNVVMWAKNEATNARASSVDPRETTHGATDRQP
jgi:RNA polymerase sigma factor (sigma-70 family)